MKRTQADDTTADQHVERPDETAELAERRELVRNAMAGLSPAQRTALELAYFFSRLSGASAGAAKISISVKAPVPLIDRPGPPSGKFGSFIRSRRTAVIGPPSTLSEVSCTLCFVGAYPDSRSEPSGKVRYLQPPVEMSSTANVSVRHSGCGRVISAFPGGEPVGPVGMVAAKSILHLGGLAGDLVANFLLGRGVNGDVRFVGVIQEGEEFVVIFMQNRVVFVGVALGALDGQSEYAFTDGFHPIEHRLHAELLGINAPFFVDH